MRLPRSVKSVDGNVKCVVKGCHNHSDAGTFFGELCLPCYEMLRTGIVHRKNTTFIGDMKRETEYFMGEVYRLRNNLRTTSS